MVRSFALPFALPFLLGASALLLACGSTGSPATSNDGGGSSPLDGSAGDASTGDAAMGDATAGNQDAATDSATADAGDGAPSCYAAGTTQSACRGCCQADFTAGYKLFAKYAVNCACQPDLCGPPEGGVGDAASDAAADDAGSGDGGIYGQAACAATCNGTAAPSAACNTCIYSTIGSAGSFGPCGNTIVSQCIGDSDCVAYLGCVEKCP